MMSELRHQNGSVWKTVDTQVGHAVPVIISQTPTIVFQLVDSSSVPAIYVSVEAYIVPSGIPGMLNVGGMGQMP